MDSIQQIYIFKKCIYYLSIYNIQTVYAVSVIVMDMMEETDSTVCVSAVGVVYMDKVSWLR